MARTKKQAVTAAAESGQRSTVVNDGRNSRVDITNDNIRTNGGSGSAEGSDRAHRAARREDIMQGKKLMGTETEAEEEDPGECHMTPAVGVESENFYSTFDREASEAWTEVASEGPSEAPSVKSPHKARTKGAGTRQRRSSGEDGRVIRATKRKEGRIV
jgi:hypothetical protein